MSKRRKNTGMLDMVEKDISGIMSGAKLNDHTTQEKSDAGKETAKFQLRLPGEFHSLITNNIKKKKIIGSLNSYIVEATRLRLINEGFLTNE